MNLSWRVEIVESEIEQEKKSMEYPERFSGSPEDYIPDCIRRDCEGKGLYIMDIEDDDGSLLEEFQCQVCGETWHESK